MSLSSVKDKDRAQLNGIGTIRDIFGSGTLVSAKLLSRTDMLVC